MKLLILAVLVATDLVKEMAAQSAPPSGSPPSWMPPPPLGSPPSRMPPGFAELLSAKNCSLNADCAAGQCCARLHCGPKCLPLVSDPTAPKGSAPVCVEDVLRKLNASGNLPGFPGTPEGFPNLNSFRNCSTDVTCDRQQKCCETPYGVKCIPSISYISPSEGNVSLCPMEFVMKLFAPKNQTGNPMMPGNGEHPAPHGAHPPPHMDDAEEINTLIKDIAIQIKRLLPDRKNSVDAISAKIQDKVKEAFMHLAEKVEAGKGILKAVQKLLKGNQIPKPKVIEILSAAQKASPGGKGDIPWNIVQKSDSIADGLKKVQPKPPQKPKAP
ncbi:uncharacterized protein [Ambystoma mexicanum]|uniref:uncharacterized protein n=1 Tax=Ambystoma mexicanum TaxID=8296 RepID=UPI0037E909FC